MSLPMYGVATLDTTDIVLAHDAADAREQAARLTRSGRFAVAVHAFPERDRVEWSCYRTSLPITEWRELHQLLAATHHSHSA